jgi:hypothetical protein
LNDTDSPLLRHLERQVGPVKAVFEGVAVPGQPKIDLVHVASTFLRRHEIVVTRGMSAQPMTLPADCNEPRFAELLVLLPKGWPLGEGAVDNANDENHHWPLRLLKTLALHPFQSGTWLGFGHTHANGASADTVRPYAGNTELCAVVTLPSLTLGEHTWSYERGGEKVRLLAAVPLHLSELKFKQANGIDALLDRMADRRVTDRIDPARKRFV